VDGRNEWAALQFRGTGRICAFFWMADAGSIGIKTWLVAINATMTVVVKVPILKGFFIQKI
jgi:hypothetical protein